ncbi:hypothetical protein OG778_32390 [Streptomyces sp. NBC_00184]|uniref:hypothetical protein n=1 Tax=Streptomyces sp. NBC_00184 TaxID=2975673 RepID=UPI002E27BA3C|nr:hypothetical protein [Streptomyces sp. NBC_00184]
MNKRHIVGYVLTCITSVAVGAVIGTSTSAESATATKTVAAPKPSTTVTKTVAAPTPSESSTPAPKGDWSPTEWARQFQAYTAKDGTAQQKSAVSHVFKMKGLDGNADDWNAWEVKIYTDYRGEEYEHSSEAELIVDALTDWQESEKRDVHVSVYNSNGADEGSGNL